MKQRQILSLGIEGRLLEHLKEWATEWRVWLRELQQIDACRNLAEQGDALVTLLRLGRDLEKELLLVRDLASRFPRSRIVVIGDVDNPMLMSLAMDLGASLVFHPPMAIPWLRHALERFLVSEESP